MAFKTATDFVNWKLNGMNSGLQYQPVANPRKRARPVG